MSGRHHVGIIGLGVMGQNLAANMAEQGFRVACWDPWEEARRAFADSAFAALDNISPCAELRELVGVLESPRVVLLMLKAGEPVDQAIASLLPHLEAGDTVVDGGNAHYPDTERRGEALRAKGLHFVGLGVSGGEEGARHGPALMAGGSLTGYQRFEPILMRIAARAGETPCCAFLGAGGAGHFVKMIHNGIEYGVMQLIAEAYLLLRELTTADPPAMARVFRDWNQTDLESYLMQITATILDTEDNLSDGPLVAAILDRAGQKGTGTWSTEAALRFGIPAPTIAEAVFARSLAALKEERVAASTRVPGPKPVRGHATAELIADLGDALRGAIVSTYAQGLHVIQAASEERGWNTDPLLILSTWRGGCIIRARMLDTMAAAFRRERGLKSLLCAPDFADLLGRCQAGWRRTAALAITQGIPAPGLLSALAYYDGYRTANGSASLIQAQRDLFGAHTYARNDRDGSFHFPWGKTE